MYLTLAQLQIVRMLCDLHLAKLGEPEAGEVQALLSAIEETKMTTPNIEELMAECRDFDTSVYLNVAHANSGMTSKLQDAADALQSQAERIKELEATNKECVKCLGEALQESTDCHAALQSGDELPEPVDHQFLVLGTRWTHCSKFIFENSSDRSIVRALYTADQLRQARAMVRAKMMPLTDEKIRGIADRIVRNLDGRKQVLNLDFEEEVVEEIMEEMCATIRHGITGEPK